MSDLSDDVDPITWFEEQGLSQEDLRQAARCISEFEIVQYSRGELGDERTKEVDAHLQSCGECTEMYVSLSDEAKKPA
ncbi:hypothetical protein CMO91_01990 [Candidatus Woesearchaeota archaeon]|nr:hypothetical protein [Candidatus Woesearchaeota archaeon]|tara:strand:+ start:1206 stop:1439 length:234 start_codon:yes stop_codon:yes gene_type:complete